MSRFSRAKAGLLGSLEDIVPEMFAKRRTRSGAFHVVSPGSGSKQPDQMVIYRSGARRGGWIDFVSGAKGDVIDLVAYVYFGGVNAETRMQAVAWAEDRFGLRTMDAATKARIDQEHAARQAQLKQKDLAARKSNKERARKMFFAASPDLAGTPVETYFSSRGIDLSKVPNLGRSFRYRGDFEHWLEAERPRFPALISAMVDTEGHLEANHITYLATNGRGKAPVEKAKLMWPTTNGLVIRVANGDSGLDAQEAAKIGKTGVIALTEGIEDALSVAMACPDLRVWAAGSLPNLLSVPDHGAANSYLIFKDNDWGKPQATALFDRAVARLKSFSKPVQVVQMPDEWGKDVNDALNFQT